MKTASTKTTVEIRWLIRPDMPEVLQIEQASFGNPWSEEDFLANLRDRRTIGMVAEHDQKILGFMVYELRHSRFHLLRIAVDPKHRHQSIGTQMIRRLVHKLSLQNRKAIITEVRETNLDALLFLRSQRFLAVDLIRDCYADTGEDAILMRYEIHPENEVVT